MPPLPSQVAKLCDTVMASKRLAAGGLPLGTTLEHSLQLQAETAEAAELQLKWVQGLHNTKPSPLAAASSDALSVEYSHQQVAMYQRSWRVVVPL